MWRRRAGWPDWSNFRPMGGCLLWAVTWKLEKQPTFLGHFIQLLSLCYNFFKIGFGLYFGRIFHKLVWSPWRRATSFLSGDESYLFVSHPRFPGKRFVRGKTQIMQNVKRVGRPPSGRSPPLYPRSVCHVQLKKKTLPIFFFCRTPFLNEGKMYICR
jgi:hypothetical protein